jgi:hypothetical protein
VDWAQGTFFCAPQRSGNARNAGPIYRVGDKWVGRGTECGPGLLTEQSQQEAHEIETRIRYAPSGVPQPQWLLDKRAILGEMRPRDIQAVSQQVSTATKLPIDLSRITADYVVFHTWDNLVDELVRPRGQAPGSA